MAVAETQDEPLIFADSNVPNRPILEQAFAYGNALSGASTDVTPRRERETALVEGLKLIA